jgi:hypothetical protein
MPLRFLRNRSYATVKAFDFDLFADNGGDLRKIALSYEIQMFGFCRTFRPTNRGKRAYASRNRGIRKTLAAAGETT